MPSVSQPPDREAITSVEFSLSAETHPFVAASIRGGRAVVEELVPRDDAEYAEYFAIVGTEPYLEFAQNWPAESEANEQARRG